MDLQLSGRCGEGHSRVIQAVKNALDQASIDMPYTTEVHLLHDQTEATEGNRSEQR